MRKGLAEPLEKWLTGSAYKLDMFTKRRVVVIAILGKAFSSISKADPVNIMLRQPVFIETDQEESSCSTASINAYYAPELSALFLHLSGYGDLCALENFVRNNESTEDRKGFFECLSQMEIDYLRCLTFLLIYSHLLVYMEPGCRFDYSCCRDLKRANELRLSLQMEICTKLQAVADFPQDWAAEGRLAQPRFLFAFHRHLLRGDLSTGRKRELKSKLVEKLEQQICRCMQTFGLVAPGDKDCPCSPPVFVEPFVHLFSAAESPRDAFRDGLLMLIERENKNEDNGSSGENEMEERNDDFGAFLQSHIELVRQDEERKRFVVEVPELKWLLNGGKILYDLLFNTNILSDEKIYGLSCTELQFSKTWKASTLVKLKQSIRAVVGKHVNSKQEKRMLSLKLSMKQKLSKVKEALKQKCEDLWAAQKACEVISLTGNECILAVHHSLNDVEVAISKRIPHSSRARYLSTCSCGHSQALRNDPFSLKEANYDFYTQMQFSCCRDAEAYEFQVFKQEFVEDELLNTYELADKSQKSTACPERSLSKSSVSSAEVISLADLEMLLDRDNTLDEIHRGRAQSPFKPIMDDLQKNYAFMSEMEEWDEEQGNEDVQKNDEQDDEEYVEEEEIERPLPGTRRHRAHMDDYDSWSQDDEDLNAEVEVQSSYLDDDDVQLREANVELTNILYKSAVAFEEELAKLRKICAGQFLECVPNTESPPRKPLFPSWSLLCIGASNLYSHKSGLDMPNFKNGTQYLLPVDVYVTVDPVKWDIDLKEITGESYGIRSKRANKISSGNREKVKLFIGFEYECPRGHRFMARNMHFDLRGGSSNSKELGSALIRSDLPLWTKCTCRRMPLVSAQLMRLHVVTPKAPVTVTLNPRVQPTLKDTIFHTGEGPIRLEWARYYVLRFPYIYAGQHGPVQRPTEATEMGKLLGNCIEVKYIPMH